MLRLLAENEIYNLLNAFLCLIDNLSNEPKPLDLKKEELVIWLCDNVRSLEFC